MRRAPREVCRPGRAAAVLVAALAMAACNPLKDRDGGADAAAAADPGQLQCFNCHARADVTATQAPETGSLRTVYAGTPGAGLELAAPLLPGDVDHYQLRAVQRGRHPAAIDDRDSCLACHPIQDDGTGHGQRIYATADPFAPGADCATSCHGWLRTAIDEHGPAGKRYTGTLRPAALLAEPGNPHGTIWRQGYRSTDGDEIAVRAIGPGCAGCHSIEDPSHGAAPTCLSCHVWDRVSDDDGPHDRHLAAIGTSIPDGMNSACGWCHAFGATAATELARPACFNCHLSGHAPRLDGAPQLGP